MSISRRTFLGLILLLLFPFVSTAMLVTGHIASGAIISICWILFDCWLFLW